MNRKELRAIKKQIEAQTLQTSRVFMNVNDYMDIISWVGCNRIYDCVFYE